MKQSKGMKVTAEGAGENTFQLVTQDALPEEVTCEDLRDEQEKPRELWGTELANARIQSSNPLISHIGKQTLPKRSDFTESQSQGWNSGLQIHGL